MLDTQRAQVVPLLLAAGRRKYFSSSESGNLKRRHPNATRGGMD